MNDNESAKIDPRTTPLYKTSPERIGLAIGFELFNDWQLDFKDCKEVTWYTGSRQHADRRRNARHSQRLPARESDGLLDRGDAGCSCRGLMHRSTNATDARG